MTQRERQILQWIEADPMISQKELAERLGIARSSVAVHISNLMAKGSIVGRGYVLKSGTYAVVVGSSHIRISAQAPSLPAPGETVAGAVSLTLDGSGRNIAHDLSLLGVDTRLVTAYGDDLFGQRIVSSCAELGIDLSHSLRLPGCATASCVAMGTPDRPMTVTDTSLSSRITPEFLASKIGMLQNAQAVVVDATLSAEALVFLAENCVAPIFCDPVSPEQAGKILPILPKIHTLKPSRAELEALTGLPVTNKQELYKAAEQLLKLGVKRVFVSLGCNGVLAAMGRERLLLPPLPGHEICHRGCGDAFMAALVWAYLECSSLKPTALAGLAAAAITMESRQIINPALSATLLRTRMG